MQEREPERGDAEELGNLHLRFPRELRERVLRVATRRYLTLSDAVRQACIEWCDRYETPKAPGD